MIQNESMSRLILWAEVTRIMAIPDKQFKKWSKTSAPFPITREGLLVDTLIATGFRFVTPDEKGEK